MRLTRFNATSPQELDTAFTEIERTHPGALLVLADVVFTSQYQRIAKRLARSKLPAMSPFREYVEAGGLMSYGFNRQEAYRGAVTYVDKILKGAKSRELPVS